VARVIGIDISEHILDVARRNLDGLGIDNVDLREGDITALPLVDDSVDAAFANMVLHHAEDPAAMLTEMARVVRPGGVVAICVPVNVQRDTTQSPSLTCPSTTAQVGKQRQTDRDRLRCTGEPVVLQHVDVIDELRVVHLGHAVQLRDPSRRPRAPGGPFQLGSPKDRRSRPPAA
jgi:SAM-dependent methyltransferase